MFKNHKMVNKDKTSPEEYEKIQKPLRKKDVRTRGLYLLSQTDIRDDIYLIQDKLEKIKFEVDRLIKLIEKIK